MTAEQPKKQRLLEFREGEEWKDKLQDINKTVCTKPLSHSELNQIIQSLEKTEYRYQCSKEPLVSFCQSGICITRRYGIDASEREPNFGGLRKYLTDPPLWHLDMDGRTIVLDTKQLHNFSMFQQRCMEVLNQCPPDIKKSDWVHFRAPANLGLFVIPLLSLYKNKIIFL